MKLLLLIPLLVLLGTVSAYQNLSVGSFLYDNLTLGKNSSVIAGIDTSGPLQLIVIHARDFNSWFYGNRVNELFNKTVESGVYEINLSSGSYVVLFNVLSNISLSTYALGFPRGIGRLIKIDNEYTYNLTLVNASSVNMSIITDKNLQAYPMNVSLSGYSTRLSGDGIYDSISDLSLNKGSYHILFSSPVPAQAYVIVNASSSIINPLTGFNRNQNYPVGVVSYGVFNKSGLLVPYQISTPEIIGIANITALSARDFNASDNNSADGASLQFNIEMNTQINKKKMVFWLQNVVDFNTSQKNYFLVNNIWNNTFPDANMDNNTIRGSGNVTICGTCLSQRFYAYTYPFGYFNYSLPFNIKLVIAENQTVNGTMVSFGYQMLQNGSRGAGPLVFYDKVLFPNSTNSSLLVTSHFFTPGGKNLSGNYYDAELVFAGESGGAQSYFNKLMAIMWIYYYNNGTVFPFPSAYTFGQDTAETAANIKVLNSEYGNGGFVTVGRMDPFQQIVVGKGINASVANIQNSSKITGTPTTTMPQLVTGGQVFGAFGSELFIYNLVNYVVVGLVVLALFMLVRIVLKK